MFRLYVSTHIVFVAILFFGWGLGGGGGDREEVL